jgi:hypothetical protein
LIGLFQIIDLLFPQIQLKNGEKYLESEMNMQNHFFQVDATLINIYNFQVRHLQPNPALHSDNMSFSQGI